MIEQFLKSKVQQFLRFVAVFTDSTRWKTKLLLLAISLSLFFSFPSYQTYLNGKYEDKWGAIDVQVKEPLTQHSYADSSHFSKLAFRLTVPIAAHFLNIGRTGCFVIQYVCFVLLFYFIISLSYKITEDKIITFLTTLSFAFIFVGNVLVSDLRALFDVTAFCLMAGAMLSESFFIIILFSLLAYFTDERALVSSSLLFIWFVVKDLKKTDRTTIKLLLKPTFSKTAIILSWPIYFITRYLLGLFYGLKISSGGTNMLGKQINNIMFGGWTGLEGFWLLVLAGFVLLYIKRDWLLSLLILGSMFVIAFVAYSVIDITRSMAYVFPVVFIFMRLFKIYESNETLTKLTIIAFLLCLFPTYYTDGEGAILYYYPLPLRIVGIFIH